MADATFTDATTAGVAHVELMMSAEHRNQDDGHGTTTIQGSQQPEAPVASLTPGVTTRVPTLTTLRRHRVASDPHPGVAATDPGAPQAVSADSPATPPDYLVDALHEAERSAFSAGVIRYEQHGKGAARGGAAAFKRRNRGSCLVELLSIHVLFSPEVWRAFVVEFVGTFFWVFLHIAFIMTTTHQAAPNGTFDYPASGTNSTTAGSGTATTTAAMSNDTPLIHPAYVRAAVTPLFVVALVYIMAPGSGAHFNTMVSVSTALNGLMNPTRAVMYVVAQLLGGLSGAAVINYVAGGMENPLVEATGLGGCSFGDMPGGRAFVAETTVAAFLLWAFYGLAFDPQQFQVFGPVLAPIVVMFAVTFAVLASAVVMPGVGFNIARCAAPAIVSGKNLDQLWIYVCGDMAAAVIHAGYYRLVPPQHVLELRRYKHKVAAAKRDDNYRGSAAGAGSSSSSSTVYAV